MNKGTLQGEILSPLLDNISLNYALIKDSLSPHYVMVSRVEVKRKIEERGVIKAL